MATNEPISPKAVPAPEKSAGVASPNKLPDMEAVTGKRIPFNSFTKRLEVFIPEDSDLADKYHLHWFNDERGRIAKAIRAGYQFVEENELAMNESVTPRNQDTTGRVSRVVGTTGDGGTSLRAFLMKIPKHLYEESQEAIAAEVDAVDAVVRRGALKQEADENRYDKGISIKQTLVQHKGG